MSTLTRIFGNLYTATGVVVAQGKLSLQLQQDIISVDGTKVAPFTIVHDFSVATLFDHNVYATIGAYPSNVAYYVEFDPDPTDGSKPPSQKDGFWRNYWEVPNLASVGIGSFIPALRGAPNFTPGIPGAVGSGTAGTHAKWVDHVTLGDSNISEVGATTTATGDFAVTGNAAVTGNIALTGTLNGQTISSAANFTGSVAVGTTLTVSNTINGQTISSAASFTGSVDVATDITISGNAKGSTYASRTTSWNISLSGDVDVRTIYADELTVKRFISDLEQALAGGQTITKSVAVVSASFSVPSPGASVSSITRSGTTATVTTATAHGFSNSDSVQISGAVQSAYNGIFTITLTDSTHFTYTVAGSPTTPATGTIIAQGARTLSVEDLPSAPDMPVFQAGDMVVLRSFTRSSGGLTVGDCIGVVTAPDTSPAGTQNWTFVRNLGTDGGSTATLTTVSAKSLALDYGVSGNGYWEVETNDGTLNTTSITRSSTTATATTTSPHGFQTGDTVQVSGATQSQYNGTFTVTVTSGTVFTYTVSGSPATPATGTILINGTNGTNAPYSQVVTWATSPVAANKTVRTRVGNLRGLTGTNGEYGLLAGAYASTGGRFLRASSTAFELHGIDILLWDGSTNTVKIDHAAPSIALGSPVPSAYGTGVGVWTGKDSSVYKLRVGDPAGNRLAWDGTNLTLVSVNTTIDSTGITIVPSVTGTTFSTSNAYRFTAANGFFGLGGSEDGSSYRNLILQSKFTGTGSRVCEILLQSSYAGSGTAAFALVDVTASSGASQVIIQASSGHVIVSATQCEIQCDTVVSGNASATAFFRSDYASAQGEWTSTTPTWGNVTVGNGTSVMHYTKIGKTVFVHAWFIFGSTSAFTGAVLLTLPYNNTNSLTSMVLGNAEMYSGTQFFRGRALLFDATRVQFINDTGGAATTTNATGPFTWATGAQFDVFLVYETP
jgi:cytoskeletal protein CcmA (bactofilin family)